MLNQFPKPEILTEIWKNLQMTTVYTFKQYCFPDQRDLNLLFLLHFFKDQVQSIENSIHQYSQTFGARRHHCGPTQISGSFDTAFKRNIIDFNFFYSFCLKAGYTGGTLTLWILLRQFICRKHKYLFFFLEFMSLRSLSINREKIEFH